jgi:hypothetical protein
VPVSLQFLHHRVHGVAPHDGVHRPIRAQHQQPRGFATPGHVGEPLDGRQIAPVQIFQHQHEGALGRQRPDHLGQLPQHPRLRGAAHPALEGFELLAGHERRQLHQPARRLLA